MTITTQHTEVGGIDAPDDQHPGTLDVRWAEEALRRPQRTDQPYAIRQLPPRRRPRRGLRRVIAAVAIASCLVVGISIAPGNNSPAPRWTPAPATTSRPAIATSTNPKIVGSSSLFQCPLGQPMGEDAIERFALSPDFSCVGAWLGVHRTTATRLRMG